MLVKTSHFSKDVRYLSIAQAQHTKFTTAVRLNLDPFDEHSEEECWDVLKRCHLVGQETTDMNRGTSQIGTIRKRNAVFDSLDSPISSAGGSLSAGQRQLVALARALLRRSQVILTDEATSAIDLELDNHVCSALSSVAIYSKLYLFLRFNKPSEKRWEVPP